MALRTNLGGTGQLSFNGSAVSLGATLTDKIGGRVRTPKVGIDGVKGSTTKYVAGMLEVEFIDDGSLSIPYLQGIVGATALWQNDNGKTVTYTGVDQVEQIDTNPVEATVKVQFSYLARNEIAS